MPILIISNFGGKLFGWRARTIYFSWKPTSEHGPLTKKDMAYVLFESILFIQTNEWCLIPIHFVGWFPIQTVRRSFNYSIEITSLLWASLTDIEDQRGVTSECTLCSQKEMTLPQSCVSIATWKTIQIGARQKEKNSVTKKSALFTLEEG